MKGSLFSKSFMESRVQTEDTSSSERILGYFLGPCLVYMIYHSVAGTYLTQFYTDVLGLSGIFLTMMPLISKILSSATSFLMGRMIDRTHTAQGKARPWIFASGGLLAICGILLYTVPKASYTVQLAWIIVSYNLFFSLAFSMYAMSHSLMVPLSTQNTKQRDSLAMLTSMAISMLPGMLVTVIMPLLVQKLGVGLQAQPTWICFMSVLSIIAIPAVLVEYYFTKERVTASQSKPVQISVKQQLKACLTDRYWITVMIFTTILHFCSTLSNSSMLYYSNWVLGNSIQSGAVKQILVNAIGQFPMGIGVVLLWPLVRKYGKRKITVIGFFVAAIASLGVFLFKDNLPGVLACLFIKSFGSLPAYTMSAYLAESMDHVAWKNGFRVDGFSASVNTISQTVTMGLAQSLLLFGIQTLGYITPSAATQTILQPEAVQHFFQLCFSGVPIVGFAVCAVIMIFYNLENKLPLMQQKT